MFEWQEQYLTSERIKFISSRYCVISSIYYMEESVLLGTKPLVDSTRHFNRDPNGVFSVCHLCECRIRSMTSRFPPFAFVELVSPYNKKEHYTVARRYEFYVLVARTISHSFASLTREILLLPLEHKIHIFSPPCNILYI